jgi:hypothetical protein
MVSGTLVDQYIEDGARFLRKLDQAGYPFNAAFWYFNPESEKWQLAIATWVLDRFGPFQAYQKLSFVLPDSNVAFSLSDVTLLSPHDPLIRLLAELVKTGPDDIGGRWLPGGTINRVYVGDAYIYRMNV